MDQEAHRLVKLRRPLLLHVVPLSLMHDHFDKLRYILSDVARLAFEGLFECIGLYVFESDAVQFVLLSL